MDLDELDLALVEHLRVDGRASYEALGARSGLSRTAARARIKRIFESGAVRVVALVHPDFEGLHVFAHVAISLDGASSVAVATGIADLPASSFVSVVSGRYSVVAELRAPTLGQLSALVAAVRSTTGVDTVDTLIYSNLVKAPHIPPHSRVNLDQLGIDAVDRELLEHLRNDGRIRYAELATRVGVSKGAARARVIRLIDAGVIAISGLVNPTALGMTHMSGFQLHLAADGLDTLEHVRELAAVDFLSCSLGRSDAVGTVITRSRAETVRVLDHIRGLQGVHDLESWTHLSLIKEDYNYRPIGAARGLSDLI